MKYFTRDEQNCNCGCDLVVDNPKLEAMMDEAREHAAIPFIISSWNRCNFWNKHVGGSLTSSHVDGDAVDIKYEDSISLYKIVDGLLKAGFKRILIYPKSKFIHTDVNKHKIQPIVKIMEQ